jgi:hypothetical protein
MFAEGATIRLTCPWAVKIEALPEQLPRDSGRLFKIAVQQLDADGVKLLFGRACPCFLP